MRSPSALRQLAKRITPLYHLVGWARLRRFRRELAAENRRYTARPSALPPPLLRYRVHGALDEASYREAGRAIASRIVAAIRQHGAEASTPTVLDFACGPGRVAAQVKALLPACILYGSDIDVEAIAWARAHLPEVAAFEVNAEAPPTRHADASFNVVYTVSLFTHLDEPAQLQWLAELARIVRPGGLVIASVHGALARASCTLSEQLALREPGFVHRVDRKGRLKLDGLPDSYQTTFHAREYVMRTWRQLFEIVEYDEGGLAGHQDLIVLRRPGGAPSRYPNPCFDPALHAERVHRWQVTGCDLRLLGHFPDLGPESVLLDLGGFDGHFSFEMHARHGLTCHVFEVVPEFCDLIAARAAGNSDIVVHRHGLAGSTREEDLYLAAEGSSTFADRAAQAHRLRIRQVRASDWIRDQLGDGSIDLAKINIEGGEYEFLDHLLDEGFAGRFRNLLVQFHEDVMPDAPARMARIQERLARTHRLTFQDPFIWENWRLRGSGDKGDAPVPRYP